MSRYRISTSRFLKLALAFTLAAPAWAGTFGKVIPIGGHASDLALDEARGVLYIANFTANRIEVMSLADHSIQRSMNVASQPGALALSPDGKYLVITHYGNFQAPNSPNNALTVVDLTTNSRQTIAMGSASSGCGVRHRQPSTRCDYNGVHSVRSCIRSDAGARYGERPDRESAARRACHAPAQIVATSMAVSGDGTIIFGNTDTFHYPLRLEPKDASRRKLYVQSDARTARRQRESRRHTLDLGLDLERHGLLCHLSVPERYRRTEYRIGHDRSQS